MDTPKESQNRYCIVGAGPSGLAAAVALSARGVAYDHYERHSAVGGIWDLENPGTPMYESAHFISSKTQSAFPGFPMPNDYPDYPRRDQILAYMRGYADKHGLVPKIQFGSHVSKVEQKGDRVAVTVNDVTRDYRGVICCSGLNWNPIEPKLPGTFNGEVRHSVSYRSASEFQGKRVLIVGLGNTGADIACDAARVAAATYVSIRRGYYFVPKHVFGKPADVFAAEGPHLPLFLEIPIFGLLQRLLVGDTQKLGMPKPDHRILEAHPLVNDQLLHHLRHGDAEFVADLERYDGNAVILRDGRRLEVDLVLFATGYQRDIPYLAAECLPESGHAAANFLTTFNPKARRVFTLGFTELNGALYPHLTRLAGVIAHLAHAELAGSSDVDKFFQFATQANFDLSGGRRMLASARHSHYCDSDALEKAVKKTCKVMGWTSV